MAKLPNPLAPFISANPGWVLILIIALVVIMIALSITIGTTSSMSDPNNIRRYVVGEDGTSLDDRVYAASLQKPKVATAEVTSNLTGTRDIPVFFQDYNYDMVRNADGTISNSREGMDNRKDQSDIEKRFGA